MPLSVRAYNYVSEISEQLEKIKKDYSEDFSCVRYVVPSGDDKLWLPDKKISPENLWTWDEIYKNICTDCHVNRKRVLAPPDHLLILNSILKNALSEYQDKVEKLPGLTRPGFLNIISTDIRELLNEAVTVQQLEFNPESENASEFLLPSVYGKYLEYLEKYNLLDSAQIYSEAHQEIIKNQTWGRDLIFIFVGFLSFTHAQLDLILALGDRCKDVIILKPETNLNKFYDASRQIKIKNEESHAEKSQGKIEELCIAEPGLEPEVIARKLALEFNKNFKNFDEIGIMIERGREEIFSQAFERYGIPYDFSSGIKINLTLPGKILSAVRHLNSRSWPNYETAMLLTQPCFAGNKFPVMKAYHAGCSGLEKWEEFLSSNLEDKDSGEIFKIALLSIKAIKKFCGIINKAAKPEKIMSAFYDFLTSENLWLDRFTQKNLAEFPELDEAIRNTANTIETINGKILALNELLPDLGAVQSDRLNSDEAYDFLERWCANTDTRPPLQISDAVRIFTGIPPVLSRFPVWIMTGVTQKTWSANINSSPLLGETEREKIAALPNAAQKASQTEARFRRLIQVGEKFTIISRPILDEEGRPLSSSPFFEKFCKDMGTNWQVTRRESEGIKILLGSNGNIFPEIDPGEKISRKIPVIFKTADAVGASDIHKLLSCPFLWWQEKGANLYPQNIDLTSPTDWGLMLHKFWQRVWRIYRTDFTQNFLKIIDNEWKILTETQSSDYEKYSALVKDFRLTRKLEGIKFRVDRLAGIQNEILESLHKTGYSHENIFLEEEACLNFQKENIKFLGQCDRIEILRAPGNKKIAFIADYKEGIGKNSEEGMSKIENCEWNFEYREKFAYGLQLSVYAALFEKNYDAELNGVYILGLEDGKISGSIFNENNPDGENKKKKKDENKSEIYKIFENYKSEKFNDSIFERIDEGNYAMSCAAEILKKEKFSPEYQSDLCQFCKIRSLCRRGEFRGEFLFSEE